LCDDEVLVVLAGGEGYRAHPFPTWGDYLLKRAEKTWNVQYSVPVSGIFFLQHAEVDDVVFLGEGQAAVLMNESAGQVCEKLWGGFSGDDQARFRRKLFNNACEIAKIIPAYRLGVSLGGKFWEKIEQIFGA
jgi:SynChlorMet cassette protein ScmC